MDLFNGSVCQLFQDRYGIAAYESFFIFHQDPVFDRILYGDRFILQEKAYLQTKQVFSVGSFGILVHRLEFL